MKEILLRAARDSGCSDADALAATIDDALQLNLSPIDEVIDSKLVDEEGFLKNVASELGIGWLDEVTINDNDRKELLDFCPAPIAVRQKFLPVSFASPGGQTNGEARARVNVAIYDPANLVARQAVAMNATAPATWVMMSKSKLEEAQKEFYGFGAVDMIEMEQQGTLRIDDSESEESNIIDEDDDEDANVSRLVKRFIREALEQRATDIHIEPMSGNLQIRYRIDGRLQDIRLTDNIKNIQSSLVSNIKVMAKLDIAERRLPQDGRINLELNNQKIDVRVATIPSLEGESVSLRLLGQEQFNLGRLGLSKSIHANVEKLLAMPNGIVLVTGPTGSGKSTTLYTFLSSLNPKALRIVTIEDPVEHKLDGVLQIPVQSEIGLSFAHGLRSILRGDPNVVMVGEIRDLETAEIAIRAAQTGHLVFSTLHTNDAIGGVSRLIDMGVEPFLVGASVRAFMAQRLVRKLCSHCRKPATYSRDQLLSFGFDLNAEEVELYRENPEGCDHCRSGFLGRLAIYEIAMVTETLGELISSKAPNSELKAQAEKDGYVPMRGYGWEKALTGETTIEEVVQATAHHFMQFAES